MEDYEPSTYGDRIAGIYDDLYQERLDPTDAVELLASLAGGGRALELGIGTGRVALPLAARGVKVFGIDSSEAMVARLREKPGGGDIDVSIGNFVDVDVDGTFALIYIPFTTLFALPTQDEQLRCLSNVGMHLDAGGRLVLDAFVPDPIRFGPTDSAITTEDVGANFVMIDAIRHDRLNQVIEGQHMVLSETGTRLFPLRIRYCWPSELDLMARLAGLELENRFADYDRSPFDADSDRHVSIYRLVSGT